MRCILLSLVLLTLAGCSTRDNEESSSAWETPSAEKPVAEEPATNNESPDDRTSWQNPVRVIEELGAVEGKKIADIGAGTGYFTFLLADAGAQVIAIDIEQEYLDYIRARVQESSSLYSDSTIETRVSEPDDPLLLPGEVDIALLVNTFTFLPQRTGYLMKIAQGLKKKGILCIVDYKSRNVPVISEETPVLAPEIVQEELRNAGFRILKTDTTSLEYQYIITATPNP